MPTIEAMTIQDHPSGIFATLIEFDSKYPNPFEEKKNSPTMAPIILAVVLIFKAVNTYGKLFAILK